MITKTNYENAVDKLFNKYNYEIPKPDVIGDYNVKVTHDTMIIVYALNAGFNLLANILYLILQVLIEIRDRG